MPIDQNVIASGLSLTRESGHSAPTSQLLPVVEECRQGLLARQKEPHLTKLQEIAEQSQDPEAACLACVLLGAYYDNSFHSCPNGDPDRVLYYAETVKGLGEAYRARYHYILCCHFLHLYNIHGRTEPNLGKAMEHAAEALKRGDMDVADILADDDNINVICAVKEDVGCYWGTAYLACRVRMKDPSLSPLEREELGFKATSILQEAKETAMSPHFTNDYHRAARAPFPTELQHAQTAAADRPEDAKLLDEIAKLCRRARVISGPSRVDEFFSTFFGPLISFALSCLSVTIPLSIVLEGSNSSSENQSFCLLGVLGVALAVLLPDILRNLEQRRFSFAWGLLGNLNRQKALHVVIAVVAAACGMFGGLEAGSFEESLPIVGLLAAIFFPPISVWWRYHHL